MGQVNTLHNILTLQDNATATDWMAPNWGFAFGGNNIFFCWKRDTVRYHHKIFSIIFIQKKHNSAWEPCIYLKARKASAPTKSASRQPSFLPPAKCQQAYIGDAVAPHLSRGRAPFTKPGRLVRDHPPAPVSSSLSISGTVTASATSFNVHSPGHNPGFPFSLFQWKGTYLRIVFFFLGFPLSVSVRSCLSHSVFCLFCCLVWDSLIIFFFFTEI